MFAQAHEPVARIPFRLGCATARQDCGRFAQQFVILGGSGRARRLEPEGERTQDGNRLQRVQRLADHYPLLACATPALKQRVEIDLITLSHIIPVLRHSRCNQLFRYAS